MKRTISFLTAAVLTAAMAMPLNIAVFAEVDDVKLSSAKTYEGEALLPLIDENSVIPFYDLKDDGYENLFKTYQKGDFISQFENKALSFVAKAKEGEYVYWALEDYSDVNTKYVAEQGNAYTLFKSFYDGSVKLPANAEDVRISWVETIRTPMFLYYRTDEGEFIVLNETYTSKYAPDKTFEAGKAYSPDEFVDYCVRVKDARVAAAEVNDRDEEFITTDENGDVVTVTPKPTAAPKETVKPEETDKPEKTAEPTVEPTASPIPQTLTVEGGEEIKVNIGGEVVAFPDAKPFIDENDRTQVPVRAVAEMLDCKVDWNGETQTVTITKDNELITLVIGEDVMNKNSKQIQMDTKAMIKDERTYIPVRFVAEALGLTVEWK